jgi:hypothetical protein
MKQESPKIIYRYSVPTKNSYQRVCLNPCSKEAAFSEEKSKRKKLNQIIFRKGNKILHPLNADTVL